MILTRKLFLSPQFPSKLVGYMAKRRRSSGKKTKHGDGRVEIHLEEVVVKRRKKMFLTIAVIILILAIAIILAYFFLFATPEPEEEIKVLTTAEARKEGYPGVNTTFSFMIYNSNKGPDTFSTTVIGLPTGWELSTPDVISVEGNESVDGSFTVKPSPEALNDTYSFRLNVTSENTQDTYSLVFKLTVLQLYGIEMHCYNNTHDADPGNSTDYLLIIYNHGNGLDSIDLSYDAGQRPDDWVISFEFDTIDIPAYSSRVVICTITTDSSTSKGRYDIDIIATSEGGTSAQLRVNTSLTKDFGEERVEEGDKVQVNYIGCFSDGVIFDTSYFEVANNSEFPKTDDFTIRPSYSPLKMYVGEPDPDPTDEYGKMIEGFWEGVIGMKVNETKVVRFPSEKGYNDGQTRIFEITLVSIDE